MHCELKHLISGTGENCGKRKQNLWQWLYATFLTFGKGLKAHSILVSDSISTDNDECLKYSSLFLIMPGKIPCVCSRMGKHGPLFCCQDQRPTSTHKTHTQLMCLARANHRHLGSDFRGEGDTSLCQSTQFIHDL